MRSASCLQKEDFVKFCKEKNCYVEVGDTKAREKVGHALRELTSSRSSTPSSIDDTAAVASKSAAKMTTKKSGTSSSSTCSSGKTSKKSVAKTVKTTAKTTAKKGESCSSSSDGELAPRMEGDQAKDQGIP